MNEYTRNMLKANYHRNMANFWLGLEKWVLYFAEMAEKKGNTRAVQKYSKKFYKCSQKCQKSVTKSEDYIRQATTFRILTE